MFLKPTVTADFADRVGHDFHHHYSPEPNSDTYLALLALLALLDTTRAAIATRQHGHPELHLSRGRIP